MATAEQAVSGVQGGAFLLGDTAPEGVFTPEDLNAEHLAIGQAADEFFTREVQPALEAILKQQPGAAVAVLRKAAAAGLTAITIPEQYGGLELDLASSLIAAEHLGRDGSYAAWHGAHTGIGTLPVLYFGTDRQKEKYLPLLASADLIAAYALTEPQAGSDALAATTRADLSPDGQTYLLNGQKMWITNGGEAGLFTVFAKVGGKDFTAFLVERSFGGVQSGVEEKKMGIKGSSTTALYFENVPVPVENVLGEIGRGHLIAFNILNLGRLNLGTLAAGGAKDVLSVSLKYAKARKAFGSPIAAFGAIQHKLAEMAIRIYASESLAWRVVGLVQAHADRTTDTLAAAEEYAVECSMCKVFGSEMLDYVADEGVQIHGGYGFHQDYSVERSYRDARINRIFEGTNEINRLLIIGMLLKRSARGKLPLLAAVKELMAELASGTFSDSAADAELRLVQNARRIALLTIGLAYQRFETALDKQQEVCLSLADILMETFAMESVLLRSRKRNAPQAKEISSVFLPDSMARIEIAARNVFGVCSPPSTLRANMSILRKLTAYDPPDSVTLRRSIATRLLERERYVA